jgi:hypothetical protein
MAACFFAGETTPPSYLTEAARNAANRKSQTQEPLARSNETWMKIRKGTGGLDWVKLSNRRDALSRTKLLEIVEINNPKGF